MGELTAFEWDCRPILPTLGCIVCLRRTLLHRGIHHYPSTCLSSHPIPSSPLSSPFSLSPLTPSSCLPPNNFPTFPIFPFTRIFSLRPLVFPLPHVTHQQSTNTLHCWQRIVILGKCLYDVSQMTLALTSLCVCVCYSLANL